MKPHSDYFNFEMQHGVVRLLIFPCSFKYPQNTYRSDQKLEGIPRGYLRNVDGVIVVTDAKDVESMD